MLQYRGKGNERQLTSIELTVEIPFRVRYIDAVQSHQSNDQGGFAPREAYVCRLYPSKNISTSFCFLLKWVSIVIELINTQM